MNRHPLLPPITHRCLLLGEGRDEEVIFARLLEAHQIDDFQVIAYNGRDNLRNFLSALSVSSSVRQVSTIIVTRDADDSAEAALEAVESAIAAAVFPEHMRVCAFIVPGKGRPGALENLFWDSQPTSEHRRCVEKLFSCAMQPNPSAKALIHAWLSLQPRANLRVGEAVSKGLITLDHQLFADLAMELRGLVIPSNQSPTDGENH